MYIIKTNVSGQEMLFCIFSSFFLFSSLFFSFFLSFSLSLTTSYFLSSFDLTTELNNKELTRLKSTEVSLGLYEASYFDRIIMTKNGLEYDQKKFTLTIMNVGT